MTGVGGELAQLREQFPGWSFGSHTQLSATGPGGATYFAIGPDGQVITGLSPAGLAEQLRQYT